jgi:tRNA threonylcarbamoyladenosine biosynthesis protein TsaB
MILLAIDTARQNCAVGLSIDGVVLLREQTIGKGHAEILMPQIEALFAEADITTARLDRIAVTVGPGSFTGLRVGISAARGLGLVTGAPVVGISTLQAHAASALAERTRNGLPARPILALMAARADEFYVQAFDADAQPAEAMHVLDAETVAARVRQEGFDLAGACIDFPDMPSPLIERTSPDIATVLALGLVLDPASHPPRPVYGRPPDAQPQLRGKIARQ